MNQKPTVGRIVHYKSRGSADGVYPSVNRAAIITEVRHVFSNGNKTGEEVKLTVFNPEGLYLTPVWVKQGDNAAEWNWPVITN